jgi:hypothetical protein
MERDTETLSTRDLASPNEPAGDVARSGDDGRDTTGAEGQPEVYDQAPPVREETRLPVEEQMAPGGQTRTQAPAGDQSVEAGARSTGAAAPDTNGGGSLLPADMDATFQRRWEEIQTRFVDEPRGAVEDADGLVANLMQQLAEGFAKERERLEAQWGRGEDISTEDLRVALQRYRTFFQRLLST